MLHVITMATPTPIEVMPGDVVRVDTTFSYKGPAQSVPIYAGIGKFGLFGWNPVEPNEGTTLVDVDSPDAFTVYEASVFIEVVDTLGAGTYDVMAMPVGHDEAMARADDVIIVAGEPGLTSMLGIMMAMMMLAMVMPMVTEGLEEEEAAVVPVD